MCVVIPLIALLQLFQVVYKAKINGVQGRNKSDDSIGQAMIMEERNWTEPCDFYPVGTGSIPVILMALGRSGSSVTWDTLSALTGERNVAFEVTGGNPTSSQLFFDDLEKNELVFYNWTVQRLCHIQQRRPNITKKAGISGFQWKPYMSSFDHDYAIEGLNAIGASTDPEIKVIYLQRNSLDRKISNLRHKQSKKSDHAITAHCAVGDDECIINHSAFDTNITFPTGNKLKSWLKSGNFRNQMILDRLKDANIHFVRVSYEKLFNRNNAEEWMRALRFLNISTSSDLTMDDIRAKFSMAPTHKRGRNETISNFHDVEQTLVGTEFEDLLYN